MVAQCTTQLESCTEDELPILQWLWRTGPSWPGQGRHRMFFFSFSTHRHSISKNNLQICVATCLQYLSPNQPVPDMVPYELHEHVNHHLSITRIQMDGEILIIIFDFDDVDQSWWLAYAREDCSRFGFPLLQADVRAYLADCCNSVGISSHP